MGDYFKDGEMTSIKSDLIIIKERLNANERIKFVSPEMIHTMRQTIETWQDACKVQINLLMKCNQDLETRIKQLENAYEADASVARDIIFDGARRAENIFSLHIRLSELEKWTRKEEDDVNERMKKLEHYIYGEGDISALIGQVDNLNKNWGHVSHQVDRLETEINTVRALGSRAYHPKKPHECPICLGDGNIYKHDLPTMHDKLFGWQTDQMGMAYKTCGTCEGKGIVWG